MMDINYELYKVFFHVANSLSFSKASKQLFISQSAVSQSIKVLEKKLNHPLFTRNTKQVHLTPEGELLLKHIEPAMNLIRQGESRLLEAHSLEGGQLRIGTSESACPILCISLTLAASLYEKVPSGTPENPCQNHQPAFLGLCKAAGSR